MEILLHDLWKVFYSVSPKLSIIYRMIEGWKWHKISWFHHEIKNSFVLFGKSLDRMRLAFIYSQTILEVSIIAWAGSSVGRAPALQAGGHRFEPCSAYHIGRPRGRSSVWLERRPVTPEVASSSLVGPAIFKQPIVLRRQAVFCFVTMRIEL